MDTRQPAEPRLTRPRVPAAAAFPASLLLWHLATAGMDASGIHADGPTWTRSGFPTPQAQALMSIFAQADSFGLRPEDYLDCAPARDTLCELPKQAMSVEQAA